MQEWFADLMLAQRHTEPALKAQTFSARNTRLSVQTPQFTDFLFVVVSLSFIAATVLGRLLSAGFKAGDFSCLSELCRLVGEIDHPQAIANLSINTYWLHARNCLTELVLVGDYLLFKTNPFGYHAVNLALHVLNSVLVFSIAHRLCATQARGAVTQSSQCEIEPVQCGSQKLVISLIVATLFMVFPGNIAVLASVSGRLQVLALTLSLSCFLYALRHVTLNVRPEVNRRLFARMLSASIPILLTNIAYVALLPAIWAIVQIVTKLPKTKSLAAQAGLLILSIAFGLFANRQAVITVSATRQLAEIQAKTAQLIEKRGGNRNIALVNLPAKINGVTAFSDNRQVVSMLSEPFYKSGQAANRVIWLDDARVGEFIDLKLFKELSAKRPPYSLACWNESTRDFDLLSIPSNMVQLRTAGSRGAGKALPVVPIGSFEIASSSGLDSAGLASVFANRNQGKDINSIILPVPNGISPLDYDILELTIGRNAAARDDFSKGGALLSWSSESPERTECGAALRFALKSDENSACYRVPLSSYKRWLTCSRIRALRLDLPNDSSGYFLKSARLKRDSSRASGTLIVISKASTVH